MKKILIFTLIAILSLSSLSARPQFFFGGGVEWGKLYLGENEKEALNANSRYKTESDGSYISSFVPTIEATFIPVFDIGLGLTGSLGVGGVLGFNDGSTLYSSYNRGYSLQTDNIIDASLGIRYVTLMAKDRYLSFSSFAQYNFRRYHLLKGDAFKQYGKKTKGEYSNLYQHSINIGIGLMERYDAYYFRIDLGAVKPLDFSNGFSSLKDSGWRISMSATFGLVFTILNENEFMR